MSITSQYEVNEYGILSAIWILSCNDENPMMLYGSTKFRLGLPDSYDLTALIKKHGELFRQRCPQIRLDSWKEKMQVDDRLPLWIKEIEDKEERKKLIESFTIDDVFRSQFRVVPNAPKADINIINWGLEHIERLRKGEVETEEKKWKFLREGVLPFISILLALITLVTTSYFQYQNIQAQKQLKEYEVSFKPKQEGYANFMNSLNTAFNIATKNSGVSSSAEKNSSALVAQFNQIEVNYYSLEPFLDTQNKVEITKKLEEYKLLMIEINDSDASKLIGKQKEEMVTKMAEIKEFLRDKLNRLLFD